MSHGNKFNSSMSMAISDWDGQVRVQVLQKQGKDAALDSIQVETPRGAKCTASDQRRRLRSKLSGRSSLTTREVVSRSARESCAMRRARKRCS